jgi:aspartyl-tRNA(Asn)/glutamyl-tRNA(Gln) amidotransferase subunit B
MLRLIPVIGLEIHVELKTKSKMFCSCPNDPFDSTPNTHICPICLAHPGTLPVPNQAAVVDTVKIATALGCRVAMHSKFDRKHYFYPDLPKAYQISQYDEPIGQTGAIRLDLRLETNEREFADIGITRVHLEEDTAQLSHDPSGNTLVNFNRAGVPLVEIVSEPDVESAAEAKVYCQELQKILRYLGVSTADMEKGQMRCEANVSLQEEGSFKKQNGTIVPTAGAVLNSKVEVKNINSFRAVEKAILYEISRQSELIKRGEKWRQETRGWDEPSGTTVHQRYKETSADYRYFPEPDIPPFEPVKIAGRVSIPELPLVTRQRFSEEYGFSLADSAILSSDKHWASFTEEVVSELHEWLHSLPETASCTIADVNNDRASICKSVQDLVRLSGGWLTTKLMGAMAERSIDIRILKIKPENFAELIALIYSNRVNSTNAQKILAEMLDSGVDMDPTHIMEDKGYGQISDPGKIDAVVAEVIKNYPKQVGEFKAGKEPIIKFLIGMAMKATEGAADPAAVEKALREALKS